MEMTATLALLTMVIAARVTVTVIRTTIIVDIEFSTATRFHHQCDKK